MSDCTSQGVGILNPAAASAPKPENFQDFIDDAFWHHVLAVFIYLSTLAGVQANEQGNILVSKDAPLLYTIHDIL